MRDLHFSRSDGEPQIGWLEFKLIWDLLEISGHAL